MDISSIVAEEKGVRTCCRRMYDATRPPLAPKVTCRALPTARFLPSRQLLACQASAEGMIEFDPAVPKNAPTSLASCQLALSNHSELF
jgi:hypothetical protein